MRTPIEFPHPPPSDPRQVAGVTPLGPLRPHPQVPVAPSQPRMEFSGYQIFGPSELGFFGPYGAPNYSMVHFVYIDPP